MTDRKKILWLASWFPNRNDPYDGDFIQRHAKAAAIFHDVHVISVTAIEKNGAPEEYRNQSSGLTEQVVYFKQPTGLFSAIRKQRLWLQFFKKAILDHIKKNGMPNVVHVHVPWKSGLLALWVKKKFRLPYIVSEHWGIYGSNVQDEFTNKPLLVQKGIKTVFQQAALVVTVSRYLADSIKSATGRRCDVIIPNVVDTTLFFHKKEKYSRFTFLHVSNMVPLKNVRDILEAFQGLINRSGTREVQMVMIGNRNDEYVKQASSMGLLNQSVFFRGEIPYPEVAEEMKRCHCLVLFSDSETFSCVAAEALCCGLPVIASAAGALPELVNATNGILVPVKDQQALKSGMEDMLENFNDFNSEQIAANASSRYGYAPVSVKFSELYDLPELQAGVINH